MITNSFYRLPGISASIFRYNTSEWSLFYAPGTLVKVIAAQANIYEDHLRSHYDDEHFPYLKELRHSSIRAERLFLKKQSTHFEPVRLNLYLNQKCNLHPSYCFDAQPQANGRELSLEAIQTAAEIVASNCAKHHLPFSVTFHGGGEPVISWRLINKTQPIFQKLCEKHSIALFQHIVTNGVMTEARAEWLARTFDLIELACDGPNEIQSAQLPARSRIKNINPDIERTAQLLHEAGKTVHARVTITKESVNRQAEICQYICEKLYAQEIHVEPVYHPGRTKPGMFLDNDQVEPFIEAFFKAQSVAVSYRGEWKMPGSRLSEIHAARCNIFQQVLNLVPGDAATTCFKITSAEQARQADLSIGRLDPKAHIFVLDDRHTRVLRAGYTRPADCNHCLIEYQCTHNCPNGCPLLKQQAKSGRGGNTLCKILKKAASQQLIQLSGTLEVTPANPAARLNISIA